MSAAHSFTMPLREGKGLLQCSQCFSADERHGEKPNDLDEQMLPSCGQGEQSLNDP